MDGRELRIGNLFWRNKEVMRVVQIDHRYKDIYLVNDLYIHFDKLDSNFEPIPLTEEWLLKFGFEKIESRRDNEYEKHICYGIGGDYFFQVHFVHSIYGGTDVNNIEAYKDDNGLTELQFVHQLQNLYFALTGEELTINSKETANID